MDDGSPCSWLMAPSPSIFRKLLWAFTWPPGFRVPLLLAADFDFWQYLVTRSPRVTAGSLHCPPSKARSKFPFKKRKKEKRRANRARPRPAGRTTTNTRTGRHSTSAQTHPARPPLCTPNNTEFWAEQESKVSFARLGWEHKA